MTAPVGNAADRTDSTDQWRDDRILLTMRLFSIAIAPILVLGFVLLYFWPLETDSRFAWPISPAMTPLLMGGGYLSGAYYFSRMAIGRHWSPVGVTLPAVAAFATVMALATIIHWQNFNHSHLAFYTWAVVYFVAPPAVLALWYVNRKYDPGETADEGPFVPSWGRAAVLALGVGALSLAAFLFFAPGTASDIWPWSVSPLTSRVIAGWFTLSGTASIFLATDRRWSIWRVPMETTFIWAILILLAVARAWGDFDAGAVSTWLFVSGVIAVILSFSGFYAYMERGGVKTKQYRAA
jgi:hypothetical protein